MTPAAGQGRLGRAGRGAPYLVPAALAVAALAALGLGRDRLLACGAGLESPATQIRKALAHQDRAVLSDVYGFAAGGTLTLEQLRFEDVVSSLEAERATVVAMATAQGKVAWAGHQAAVAYVGRERFHMRPCAIARWCGEGDQLDRLRGVLAALFRRRDALDRRDADAAVRLLSAHYRDGGEDGAAVGRRLARELAGPPEPTVVRGWQVRVERDEAHVGEDLEVQAPGRPPRSERHLYRLIWEGGRWAFAAGA